MKLGLQLFKILIFLTLYFPTVNGGTWYTLPTTNGPVKRIYSRAIDYNGNAIMFGGSQLSAYSDVSLFNMTTQKWSTLSNGPALYGHTCVKTSDDIMIVFGGANSGQMRVNLVYMFDIKGNSWLGGQYLPVAPVERTLHTAVMHGNDMIIFGGGQGKGKPTFNDLWKWNTVSRSWTEMFPMGETPTNRSGHAAVVTPRGVMIVHGGWNGGSPYEMIFSDLAFYDIVSNMWLNVTVHGVPPPSVYDHSAALTSNGIMLIWGGSSSVGYSNGIYRFDISAATWLESDQPTNAPRGRSSFGYAMLSGRYLFMFNGAISATSGRVYVEDGAYYDALEQGVSTINPFLPTIENSEEPIQSGPSPTKSHKKNSNTAVIAAVVSVVCALLVAGIIVAALIVYRRTRKDKSRKSNDISLNTSGSRTGTPSNNTSGYGDHSSDMTTNYGLIARPTKKDKEMATWEVDFDELEIQRELGRGAFGVVYSGTWRKQKVAIKKILGQFSSSQVDDFMDEAKLMSKLRPHENVIQFLGVSTSPLAIVTKYYEGGSLSSFLKVQKSLSINDIITILSGVASGMEHLHLENIVHRDLAARNILIGQDHTTLRAVVSDFGFARTVMDSKKGQTKSDIGPVRWMSPESLLLKQYSPKSDVWSFGVLVWEVVTGGSLPYKQHDDVKVILAISQGEKLTPPEGCNPELKQVMESCWIDEPEKRPTFQELYTRLQT